jgi:hypothetical protein
MLASRRQVSGDDNGGSAALSTADFAARTTKELRELCESRSKDGYAGQELGLGSLREMLSLIEGLRLAVERLALDRSRDREPVQGLDRALLHLKGFFERHPFETTICAAGDQVPPR